MVADARQSEDILADYLTREAAAAEIKARSPRTIDAYRKQPDGLPWVKIAGTVYIRRDDLRAFIARRTVHPAPLRKLAR